MMDSRLQKLAMEQMSRMTPEQLMQIRNQMSDISPAALGRLQRQMANMSPAQMEQVEQRLKSTDPSSLPSVSSTIQTRQTHVYKRSMELKNEGNTLYKGGNYMAAVEKYERAKSNMNLFVDKESCELVMICGLNMANCYLKLEMYTQCVMECTEVLKDSPNNVKALYRRGQAYMHQDKNREALVDLKKTLELSTGSDQEKDLIQQKIETVEKQIEAEGCMQSDMTEVEVEEITVNQETAASSSETAANDGTEWKRSAEAVSQMTDDEIRRLNQQTGMDISPEMVRSAQAAMKDMDSETLSQMASLAEKLNKVDQKKPTTIPPSVKRGAKPEDVQMLYDMCENHPEFIKEQAKRMTQMSQEELDQLAHANGPVEGFKLTPELARQAADSITRMDAEEVKKIPDAFRAQSSLSSMMTACNETPSAPRATASSPAPLQSTQSSMQGPAPEMLEAMDKVMKSMSPEECASMARMAGNPDLSSASGDMLSNPDFLKHVTTMIQSMDEDALVNMIATSGMHQNTEEARTMVRRMKQMSPGQLETFMKAMSYGQKGVQAVKKAKDWLRSRTALICSIVIILVGIVLRLLGIM